MYTIPSDFYLGEYSVILKPKDTIRLSSFRGSTLRGALISSLNKIVCVQTQMKDCEDCMVKENCVFALLFKSFPTQDDRLFNSSIRSIPRPYTLFIPPDTGKEFSPRDKLVFKLILFGEANDFLGHIILALKRLEEVGIGKGRGKFVLEKILSKDDTVVYRRGEDKIYTNNTLHCGVDFNDIKRKADQIDIHFITPCRIKHDRSYRDILEFHHLIRSLCRRISVLSAYYCNTLVSWDFDALIQKAEQVVIKSQGFEWMDKKRYSSRQDQLLKIGGVVGRVVYEGELTPFIPVLRLGEVIQAGKNTTFGLGRYRIKDISERTEADSDKHQSRNASCCP